jgi:hypothetical protein
MEAIRYPHDLLRLHFPSPLFFLFHYFPRHVRVHIRGWWCGSLQQLVCTTNLKPVGLLVDLPPVTVSVYVDGNRRYSYG